VTQPPSYPYPPPVRYEPVAPGGAPLADFGTRLLAYLLDRVIVTAVVLVPTFVVTLLLVARILDSLPAGQQPDPAGLVGASLIIVGTILASTVVVQYFYLVTFQGHTGQTIGKRAMKIRVVSAVDGGAMDAAAARKRFLVEVGCSLIGPLVYLDGLWQLWDQPYRQCWHDKWARTVVVKVGAA